MTLGPDVCVVAAICAVYRRSAAVSDYFELSWSETVISYSTPPRSIGLSFGATDVVNAGPDRIEDLHLGTVRMPDIGADRPALPSPIEQHLAEGRRQIPQDKSSDRR